MSIVQENIYTPLLLQEGQAVMLVDIFSWLGKKRIELASHSTLTYLIVAWSADIEIEIVTKGSECSCRIFGLFGSDAKGQIKGNIKVSLDHSHTSADVDLISFLYDGAKVDIDGTIDINERLDNVHGRLLEQNIVLGKTISVKTLPQLNVASHNVRASHGAKIDSLDPQKLFYMMSRGLTKEQSQKLLVDWYIDFVLSHFSDIGDAEKTYIRDQVTGNRFQVPGPR